MRIISRFIVFLVGLLGLGLLATGAAAGSPSQRIAAQPARRARVARRKLDGAVDLTKKRSWFMPTVASADWAPLLTPGLKYHFFEQLQAVAGDSLLGMYNVQTSGKNSESTQGVSGFGDVPEWNGTIEYDSIEPLWNTVFTHRQYAKGTQIERALVDDEMYGVINQKAAQLGISFGRRRERHAVSTFINGFSTNGFDGVPLCSASHPLKPGSATVQSNTAALALNYDNANTVRERMMLFTDSRDDELPILPDTLVVPVALEATAWTVVNSMQKPGTGNNDANFLASRPWNVKVSRYLTSATQWFMADSGMAKMHLHWFDRIAPEFALDPSGGYDLVARFRGYMRYSFGFDAWQWIYGCNP